MRKGVKERCRVLFNSSWMYCFRTFDRALVFDPSLGLNFGPDIAFDSDPDPVLGSALRPVFNSDSANNHRFYFNKSGGLSLPTRNILTGAVVNWIEEEVADAPESLTLAWKDLCVYRSRKHQKSIWSSPTYEEIQVLHGVSGVISSGNLVAIMGSSGAGKTTLLAAISRRDKSAMTGQLMLNGRTAHADLIARISGFVPQQDLAVEELTVMEHMLFMARLMMDRRANAAVRTRRINQLLDELGVTSCVKTRLGALSGGERKRVSLAVQLLNDPPILFCDEPTTGLDSWGANAVVSRLRRLASGGKLVVCSVHQPASGVFELFQQLILLAAGRVAFHGTIEQADQYFASLNHKCPIGFNAAEYYVTLLGIEIDKENESRDRIRRICDEFQRSNIALDIQRKVNDVKDEEFDMESGNIFDQDGKPNHAPSPHYLQFTPPSLRPLRHPSVPSPSHQSIPPSSGILFLTKRQRNALFVGLIISIPYHGHFEELDQRDIQNVQGLLYLTITEDIFLFIYAVFITFPSEMPILLRETASGLYSPAPYYVSKMIFWIPRAIVAPTLFASLVFALAGLHGGFSGWLGFTFICILCANYANAYGSFLSATFDSMETAALVSVPFELIGTMFSGVYLNLASVSAAFGWLRYVSGFYYGVESISILQWDYIDRINCVSIKGMPCIKTGAEVLERFGYAESNFWRNVICLTCMYFIAHIIAYVMVVRRSRKAPVY
ncbi:Protein scarlet [Eumeta japonica]|uniref:Protein scarlet n=1 Tax=Eumeta variegata TaxID=151549 RepID=A0A4C1TIQ5_EUMVA|nr:Protein scarlet [Eumeta japonica]